MSNSEFDRADKVIQLSLKLLLTLCGFACSIIFYSMWNDVGAIKEDIGGRDGINVRLKGLETNMQDLTKSNDRRDQDISEIRKTLNEIRK